jgi:hypothetical protein
MKWSAARVNEWEIAIQVPPSRTSLTDALNRDFVCAVRYERGSEVPSRYRNDYSGTWFGATLAVAMSYGRVEVDGILGFQKELLGSNFDG